MNAARFRIDIFGECVRIGAFQLRKAAPVEDALRKIVTLGGQHFQRVRIGRPGARLRLAAAFQPLLVKENFAELFRRTDIEALARKFVDLFLVFRHLLREAGGKTREHRLVDLHASALHFRKNGNERTFQHFVDADTALGDEARLQYVPEAKRHIRIFRGIGGGAVDRHLVEGDLRLALARDFRKGNGLVTQMKLGEFVHAVAMHTGIERIGHQHGVVIAAQLDTVLTEDDHVEFEVLTDLQDRAVFKKGLQRLQCIAQSYLLLASRVGEIERIPSAMLQRNVAGLTRQKRHRHADEARAHGEETVRFRVDGKEALFTGAGDPFLEIGEGRHRDIIRIGEIGIDSLRRRSGHSPAFGARDGLLFLLRCLVGIGGRVRTGGGDRIHIDIETLADAARQRVELHVLEEADQRFRVRLAHTHRLEFLLDGNIPVEFHEPLRDARLFGEFDQVLATLVLLDLGGAREKRFEITIFLDELRGGLDPDTGDARHVVGGIAGERLHVDDLFRRHAELLDDLVARNVLELHRVEHVDAVVHELHQILVGRNDGDARACLMREPRIGGDEIVRLEAGLFDAGEAEGAGRIAHQRELRHEIFRRFDPVCLVFGINVVAESLRARIENDGEMGRLELVLRVLDQLVKHVAEARDGADRKPIGLASERRQRMIGAEDVARAIDQEEMVALADGAAFLLFRGFCRGFPRRCLISRLAACHAPRLSYLRGVFYISLPSPGAATIARPGPRERTRPQKKRARSWPIRLQTTRMSMFPVCQANRPPRPGAVSPSRRGISGKSTRRAATSPQRKR